MSGVASGPPIAFPRNLVEKERKKEPFQSHSSISPSLDPQRERTFRTCRKDFIFPSLDKNQERDFLAMNKRGEEALITLLNPFFGLRLWPRVGGETRVQTMGKRGKKKRQGWIMGRALILTDHLQKWEGRMEFARRTRSFGKWLILAKIFFARLFSRKIFFPSSSSKTTKRKSWRLQRKKKEGEQKIAWKCKCILCLVVFESWRGSNQQSSANRSPWTNSSPRHKASQQKNGVDFAHPWRIVDWNNTFFQGCSSNKILYLR